MTPQELLQEYLVDHDLRQASAKIYGAAMKSLEKHFGKAVDVETIDRRDILAWRNKVIEGGLSKRSWNTYSNHLRTMWGYGIEYGILTDIATTMSYIEADYDHMRDVLHERSLQQGALHLVRRVDESAAPGSRTGQTQARIESGRRRSVEQSHHGGGGPEPGHQYPLEQICSSSQIPLPPEELFSPTLLFSLMASGTSTRPFMRSTSAEAGCAYSARASP